MPRYDDRHGNTRLYVGRLSSRTRSRELERVFSRYGRVRDVDMKHDYAFVEFSDSRDADDARHSLNGRDVDGSRIIVEFAKGVPRGSGGSRDHPGRDPPVGAGRCFNCGLDGHWARDCKAGDWKNKCYRCGDRGHIERNCQNSPKKLSRASHSRSPVRSRSPRHDRSRSRSYSKSRSPRREGSIEPQHKRARGYSMSPEPEKRENSPPTSGRKHSPNREGASPSPKARQQDIEQDNMSEYSESPKVKSRTFASPEVNGCRNLSPNPRARNGASPVDDDRRSPRGSESP